MKKRTQLIGCRLFSVFILITVISNFFIAPNMMAKSDSTVIVREIIPMDSSIYKSMIKIIDTARRPHSGCYSDLFGLSIDSISEQNYNWTNGYYKNHTLIKYKIKHNEIFKGVSYPLFTNEIYPYILDYILGYFKVKDCIVVLYSRNLIVADIKSYFSQGIEQQEFTIFNPLKKSYKYTDCEWMLYFYKGRLYNLYNDYIYDKVEEDANYPVVY